MGRTDRGGMLGAIGLIVTHVAWAAAMLDPTTLARTGRPNDALVCPASRCAAAPDRDAPTYAVPTDRLLAAWKAVAAAEPRTRIVAEDAMSLNIEQHSRLLGFVDTIAIRVLADGDGATFAFYSRSETGRYDFGVNRSRAERWAAALDRGLGGTRR